MKKPVVSCIVPVFNGEQYVREALESIHRQTYQPLEIIVVDDGSTDNTKRVVTNLKIPIQYVEQSNLGPPAARNQGIRLARGAFVAFLDADDLWHQEKLTKQMAQFQAKPELEVCVTHLSHFEDSELGGEDILYQGQRRLYNIPGYITQTLLTRRTTFEKVGNFDHKLRNGDSSDWFLRAADLGVNMELLPEVLVYRRLHSMNYSRQKISASLDEHLAIIKASLDRRRKQEGGSLRSYQFPTSDWRNKNIQHKKA
jgi:glycosyltransferase involved in cell wall biosynthesis